MAEVIPAILEKDFSEIEKKIRLVEHHVSWVQIDIADNTLVPNKTCIDPLPFKTLTTEVNLELHMMVKNPLLYLSEFIDAKFRRFFHHIEGEHVEDYIIECQKKGVGCGLAIDGPTPVEDLIPYIKHADTILVMAIKAGFSGAEYREDTASKVKQIYELGPSLPIAVDGAMNAINAEKVVKAGAVRINSNSYIFQSTDLGGAISTLRALE